jgi:hypothetical protein
MKQRAEPRRAQRAAILVLGANSRGGTRTPDPVINSHLLYQLSYSGKCSNCNDLLPQTQPRTRSKLFTDAPDSTAPVPNALGISRGRPTPVKPRPRRPGLRRFAIGAQKEHLEGPGPEN